MPVVSGTGTASGVGAASGADVAFEGDTEIICVSEEQRGMKVVFEDRAMELDPWQ